VVFFRMGWHRGLEVKTRHEDLRPIREGTSRYVQRQIQRERLEH